MNPIDAQTRPRPLPATLLAVALAGLALPLAPSPAGAHGDAVLELASNSVAAGTTVTVEGSSFETGSAYRLRLVGAMDQHDLTEVRPDSEGAFSLELRVPAAVADGRWELIAVAPDGDVVARTPLTVVASSAGGGAAADGAPDDGQDRGARAGEIDLERERSGSEWGAIGLLVGLAGGLGVGLLRG
jgi:hypothetical protein